MEKSTRQLLTILAVLSVIAVGSYLYRHVVKHAPPPPKIMVHMGAPIPKGKEGAVAAKASVSKAATPAKAAEEKSKKAEAAKAPAPAVAQPAAAAVVERKPILYASLGKRDPFMSPFEVPKVYPDVRKNARPLERVPAEQVQVRAIVWSQRGYRALVVTPDGRGYTIKTGDKLGNKGGTVVGITDKRVTVIEKIQDILGNIETNKISLQLHKEAE